MFAFHKIYAMQDIIVNRPLDAIQDVVATLFDEYGRVDSSSCHAVSRGRSVD